MRVLSLFDGISCGRLALKRAGIKVDTYYASEVDKYAIQIAKKNFHNTIHIGSVLDVKGENYKDIDLLIGGSPCQSFSIAGNQTGFDGKSGLFYEYLRILREVKPKYFLLENVKMKKEFQDIISKELGVDSIEINSSLVSAQSRKRLYWTNITGIEQPEDKGIFLKDIITSGFYNGDVCENRIIKKEILEQVKVRKYPVDIENVKNVLRLNKKISIQEISDKLGVPKTLVEHWFRNDKSFAIPREDVWFNLKNLLCIDTDIFDKSITEFDIRDGKFDMANRVYKINGKSPTLTTITGGKQKKIIDDNQQIRELSIIECERLQTLDDNYTEGVSNSQRFKMVGNGWTVDVISHILSFI